MSETKEKTGFSEWCIIELMGHRRLAGLLSEALIAGAPFLRLDIPETKASKPVTQFYSPSAVYCITPTSEELARATAEVSQTAPVARWELQLPQGQSNFVGVMDGDEED